MEEKTTTDLLQVLRRDIAVAEMHLAELRRLEGYLLSKLEPEQRVGAPGHSFVFPPVELVQSSYLRHMTQADAAEVVLKEAGGGPLDTATIVRAMVARGFRDKPERKNLISSVFAVMSKLPNRFRKVGRGLWTLADQEEDTDGESETGRRS